SGSHSNPRTAIRPSVSQPGNEPHDASPFENWSAINNNAIAAGAQTERRGKAWAGEESASWRDFTGRLVSSGIRVHAGKAGLILRGNWPRASGSRTAQPT